MASPDPSCFIVADIGGTNTRISLSDGDTLRHESLRRYQNQNYAGFDLILRAYLEEMSNVRAQAICVAVAGPVSGGRGRLTNRDWDFDEAGIAAISGAPEVALLNDLQAQGYALAHISAQDLTVVRHAQDAGAGTARLAVNIGTGFNASPVFDTPAGPYVATSEAGHASMPTRDARDVALCAFVAAQNDFAAIDDILSGRGLETVYAFVAQEAGVAQRATSAEIIAGCRDGSDPLASEAVSYFIHLAGGVIGNLALVQLPFGGIFLVGGLASAIAPFIAESGFEAAFRDKGRFAPFMDQFSVSVVQDDYAGLKGMAAYLAARTGL